MAGGGRVTENDVAFAIIQIGKTRADGIVTFNRCRKEIPNYLSLSAQDRAQSETRPNEEVWEQQIRNIKSHSTVPGNYIHEGYLDHLPRRGYQITASGAKKKKP